MQRFVLWTMVPAAFVAGIFASQLADRAQAADAALKPQIIDLAKMTDAEIGKMVPNIGTLRAKTLVSLPQGAVSVQTGDVPKHFHSKSNEIQYIISGTGTFWLGKKKYHIHPGDLIIVPEGVVHAGSHADKGTELKALSIKIPGPVAGDYHPVK